VSNALCVLIAAAAAPKAKAVLEARIKALEGKVAAREQGGSAAGAAAVDAIAAGDAETGNAICSTLAAVSLSMPVMALRAVADTNKSNVPSLLLPVLLS
jgi:hypothetical protein